MQAPVPHSPGATVIRFLSNDWVRRDRYEVFRELYGRTILRHDFEPTAEDSL